MNRIFLTLYMYLARSLYFRTVLDLFFSIVQKEQTSLGNTARVAGVQKEGKVLRSF